MSQITKFLIASTLIAAAGFANAQTAGASATPAGTTATGAKTDLPATGGASATSTDPYIQKRESDAAAKKQYKAEKKAAKAQYKHDKAVAKSDLKSEKTESTAERNGTIAADPAKPALPGQPNYQGK